MSEGSKQHDVSTRKGLMAFYEVAFSDVYQTAARLTRGDRPAAEDLVQEAFVRLTRSARAGEMTTVGIGWMVTVVRRLHIDRLRSTERENRRLRLVASRATEPALAHDSANEILSTLTRTDETWTRANIAASGYQVYPGRQSDPLRIGVLISAATQLPEFEGSGCWESVWDQNQS